MIRLVKLTEQGKKKETASGGGTVRLVKLNAPKTDAAEELRREAALKRARDQMAQLETPEKAQLRQEAAQKRARDMQTRSDRIELENLNRLSREAQREREKKTGGGGVLGLLAMAGRSADSTLPLSGSGQVALDLNSSPAQLAYDRSLAQFRAGEIARAKAQQDAQMKRWAAEHPVKGSAASVVTNIMSGAEALADLTAYGSVGEMMPEGMDFSPAAATGALREGASSRMGNAGQFVYSTGMSAIDSLVSNEVLLGLSAASNAIRDVKARGGTDRQAAISGVFSGLAESFFEHVSLGQLRALKDAPVDGIKTLLKNMGKQMFVNFSEESFTELANILFDSGFMGDLSNYAELARQYMDEGMSEKEAKRRAVGELARQIGLAGASGALMGLGFGALGSAQGYLGSRALNISAQTDSGAKRPGQAAQEAVLKPADGTLSTGDNRTGEQTGEARQQSETQRAGGETAEQYPNLRKVMDGEAADPNAVAAEAAKAVDAGVITGEEGLELTRRAITAQRTQQQQQTEQRTEQKAPGYHGDANDADAEYLDRLGKAAGVSIERAPAAEAGNREGWIIGGRVYLSENGEDPVRLVAKHEVTHHMQEMAPEAYNAFRDYVENIYRENGALEAQIEGLTELYRKNNQELTAQEALDELTANYAGELMDNEALIRRLAGEDRNLAQRVLDAIRDLVRRLKGAFGSAETRQLERAARLWEQALEETNAAYYQEGKRSDSRQERNMYAGEKSATADLDALARAKKMDGQDVSAETIRQETGWFKGMDGKWRYEIDDSKMRYERRGDLGFRQRHPGYDRYRQLTEKAEAFMLGQRDQWLTMEEQQELTELQSTWGNTFRTDGRVAPDALPTTKLTDYIDHPELFEAYPELRDASLVFAEMPEGTRGQYDRERNIIRVSQDLRHAPQETLLHEIQHAVQQIEGFAGGASVGYWSEPKMGAIKPDDRKEIAKAEKEVERWEKEFEKEWGEDSVNLDLARKYVELTDQWGELGDQENILAEMESIEEAVEEAGWDDLLTGYMDARAKLSLAKSAALRNRFDAVTAYRNTAGEIEARDTGKRRDLTADERKKTAPDLGGENVVFAEGESIYQDAVIQPYHTKEQKKVIREYNAAVDPQLLQYVKEVISEDQSKYKADYRMGEATPEAVAEVYKLTGVDTTGFDTIIKKSDVEHTINRHGSAGKSDTTMRDPEDIARVKYVLDNFDNVELGKGTRAVRDKNGKPAQTVVFSKKINGTYYVVEAVADNKARATRVISAYMSKDGDAQVANANALARTSENEPASTPVSTVPQERRSVKGARELQKQIDRLERQNKRLQEQMKRTDVPKASRKAVERQAAELREAYGSRIDKTALADRIEGLYEKIAAKSDGDANAPGWKDIKTEARTIADDILAESRGNVNPKAEEYAGLRRELQKTKVSLSPEYRADLEGAGGYNELRKRLMGSLILSNEGTPVDVLWNDLSDRYPELFPDDIYQPADQLLRLAEVVQSLKKVEGNPYGQDMEHTAAYLAGEIEERFFDTPQEKPTQADKMEAKYHRQRLADQRVNAEKLRRQREAHAQELKDMEAVYAEENRRRIERQSTAERRETILRHAQRLGRKLVRPTDKQHVPEDMRGAALAMVTYLDLESNYETVYGKDAKYHRVAAGTELGAEITNRTAAARALQAEYRRLAEEDTSLTIDPDMDDYLDEIARMGNKRVADMNRSELDTVWKAMQVVEHTISRADDLLAESRYRTVSQMADALREENGGKKDRANWAGGIGMADKLLNLDMLAPETFFHRMGKAGEDIFRQMRRAADRQTVILKEGTDRARKLIEESGVSFEKADAALHTFDLDGGALTLSTGQIMELYALSKREQALEHIYIGGLKPVDATLKGKLVSVSRPVKVSPADVAEIISKLSDKERTLIDGLQKYLSGDLARHGNEESRKVYGYDKFREKNYWPIKVSAAQVASDPAKAAGAKTIPGYGMTKTLKPKARNAVELRSAIDTYSNHLNQMATYAAWLGTSENVTRLHNFKYQGENNQMDGTVKELLEKVYGKSGSAYLENLMSDIAQGTKAGADRSFAEMGLSRFKAAKVGGNLRVIVQQPTAILRAMGMIDPKYFAAAKSPLKGWEKAKEHSPIAQWKDWGYFEMDTGRSLRELMTGTENKLDKAKNAMMAPAGMADSVAWGHLWNAVEAETLDKRPELEQGSKAFYEAVAERFGEVVDRTQVVDTVLHRTQIMRSSNYANKVATSFMSEPSKVYNMVLRAFYDLNAATAEETRKAAGKRLARTSAALITSFAVNALAQSVVDALRDDDRDKDYWEKQVDNWGENFAENFNAAGYVPYAKDVVSLLKGYTLDRSEMEGVADAIASMQRFTKAVKGESQKTVLAAGLDAASKLGDLIGLPVSNIRRDAGAIFHTVMNGVGAGRVLYRWNKIKYNPETAMSIFQNDLYRAMDTDWATYEMIYNDITAEYREQGLSDAEAADKIAAAMESRMKKSLGVNSVGSLPIRYSPPGTNPEFDAFVKKAIGNNTQWEEALPENVLELVQELDAHDVEKTERVLMIADLGMEQGWADSMLRQTLSDSEVERYEQCRKQGVTMKEWAAAYSAIGGAAFKRTGKRSPNQEDVKKGLNSTGLSEKKKTAIWNSYGWKAESPWS